MKRYFLTGLLVLVPAWGTFLILHALFSTLDGWIGALLGRAAISEIPGLGLATFLALILTTGILATHFLGERVLHWTDRRLERIPLVGSIYLTLKGVTDLFKFRERFGRSAVVVFPFPRRGLWALGFVMGPPPAAVQAAVSATPTGCPLTMIFVPTAIHPFTGYLAFIPKADAFPVNLPAEEAIKMEFSAGLYRPRQGWLSRPTPPDP
jgi:uncharacterized membrane protein